MPLFMKSQIKQSEKQSFPNTNLDRLEKDRSLPTTSQLHLFCTTCSLLRTILDPASWWLSQSCDSYAAALAVGMWAQMGQITNTSWKNTCGMLPVQLQEGRPCEWSPTQTWIALGKPVATYNFAASPSLHYIISTQDHFRPC